MCLVALAAVFIYILVATFFITARILLPWTIAATVLAGLSSLGFVVAIRPRMGKASVALSFPITMVLTVCYGYLGCLMFPPQAPPSAPPSKDIVQFLLSPPKPNVSQDDLWTMLPIHLCISGVLGGVIAISLATSVWLAGKEEEEAVAGESPFEKQPPEKNPDS